jgi:hypothetical protein
LNLSPSRNFIPSIAVTSRKGLNSLCRYKQVFVLAEGYNVMVSSEELIGTNEYLTVYTRCRINRCRYNGVPLYLRWSNCIDFALRKWKLDREIFGRRTCIIFTSLGLGVGNLSLFCFHVPNHCCRYGAYVRRQRLVDRYEAVKGTYISVGITGLNLAGTSYVFVVAQVVQFCGVHIERNCDFTLSLNGCEKYNT